MPEISCGIFSMVLLLIITAVIILLTAIRAGAQAIIAAPVHQVAVEALRL